MEICLLNYIHMVRETDDYKSYKRNENFQIEQTVMKFGNILNSGYVNDHK